MPMHRERPNLEDQVGGLIDHDSRRARRRRPSRPDAPDAAEAPGYDLYADAKPVIHADRASDDHRRRVA